MAKQELDEKRGLVGRIWHAVMKDGTIAAAGRQGATEFAQALRAFPETIHAQEPGTILNPTQGEITASRRNPSPGEIARDNKQPYRPELGQDNDNGMSL